MSDEKKKRTSLKITEENYENFNPNKGTIMGDDVYRYVFFDEANEEDKFKMAERLLKAVWGDDWDPETDPIKYVELERPTENLSLENSHISRGVRYDMLITTEEKTYFVMEFQQINYKNDVVRLLLEKDSLLNTDLAKRGQKTYKPLNEIVLTMFTNYDVFGDDLPKYTVKNAIVEETGKKVELPYKLAFIDSRKGNGDTELGRLVSDITQLDPEKMYDETYRRRAEKMLHDTALTQETNNFYDNVNAALDEVVEEAKKQTAEEATKKAVATERKQTVLRLVKENLPIELIARYSNVPLEEVKQIIENVDALEDQSNENDSNLSDSDIIEEVVLATA